MIAQTAHDSAHEAPETRMAMRNVSCLPDRNGPCERCRTETNEIPDFALPSGPGPFLFASVRVSSRGSSDAVLTRASAVPLTGWMRARHDKHHRLALAWQREQLRLSLEEILQAGVTAGTFRKEMVTGAVAAVMLGAAEGGLLQSATQGGAVPPGELVRALMSLALSGA